MDKEKTKGEQLDLIDVAPENAKQIIKVAKQYKRAQVSRMVSLKEGVSEKKKLLALIKEANLEAVDGKTQFHVDGFTILVIPRDELVKVKDDNESEEED